MTETLVLPYYRVLRAPVVWNWDFLFRVDWCHKWFRCRDTGWIAVADNSGREPHLTDDGVLWLVPDQEIVIDDDDRPRIQLISEAGLETLLGGTLKAESDELVNRGYARYWI